MSLVVYSLVRHVKTLTSDWSIMRFRGRVTTEIQLVV
jgi:hypothetical protein